MSAAARPLAWLMRLLAIAAMLTALFFLLPLEVPYLENAEMYAETRAAQYRGAGETGHDGAADEAGRFQTDGQGSGRI